MSVEEIRQWIVQLDETTDHSKAKMILDEIQISIVVDGPELKRILGATKVGHAVTRTIQKHNNKVFKTFARSLVQDWKERINRRPLTYPIRERPVDNPHSPPAVKRFKFLEDPEKPNEAVSRNTYDLLEELGLYRLSERQLEKVSTRLQTGVDIRQTDKWGDNLLHKAVKINDKALVELLLPLYKGAKMSQKNKQGMNVHQVALQKNFSEISGMLTGNATATFKNAQRKMEIEMEMAGRDCAAESECLGCSVVTPDPVPLECGHTFCKSCFNSSFECTSCNKEDPGASNWFA